MKSRLTLPAAWLALSFALPGLSHAAQFDIDSSHSAAFFSVSHFQRSDVRGRLLKVQGRIEFDQENRIGLVEVSLPVDAIDTGSVALDNVLKSPQFLDGDRFPVIRFGSTSFTFEGQQLRAVEGQLNLHGVTRPVVLQARRFTCGEVKVALVRRSVCGGVFHTTIRRSEFGMTRFLPDVGDAVEIEISIEASPIAQSAS